VKTVPGNRSRNFKGNQVEFTFNEFVQVENLQQELIVTPDPASEYDFKPTKYGLRITFKKPFSQENTTYTVNLRNAVKDITEKNVARDAKVVFSTGTSLDTLFAQGRVTDLETGQPVENAVVSLYRASDTLDIQKNKPYYFTRTDKQGNYRLENLSRGNYRMYALSEKDNNQRYNQEKEKIDFLPEALVITDSSRQGLDFKVSVVDENPPKISSKTTQSDIYLLEMNEGLTSASVQLADSTKQLAYIIDAKSPKTIRLYNTIQNYDSLVVAVTAVDSAGNEGRSEAKIKFAQLDEKQLKRKTKIPLETGTDPKDGEPILRNFTYTFAFSKPIGPARMNQIQLLADTLTPIPLDEKTDLVWNNSRSQLTLTKQLEVRRGVRVVAPAGTFLSVENDTAKAIKTDHNIKDPEKYGSISGRVTVPAKHYIIQLLTNDGKVVAQTRNQPVYSFQYLPAGDYNLRIVIDRNNNGKWDAASFKDRRPAENIIYGFTKKRLKENWELTDQNVTL
jgi:uncharacterized protein (DUF2141 family)